MRKLIVLRTKKELEVYMNPSRQEILRELGRVGEPVTPKYLSDRLGISPSSIQFHLKKLETLGVIRLDHTEQIRGITARFYTLSDVDISIGEHLGEYHQEREIILENMVHHVLQGSLRKLSAQTDLSVDKASGELLCDGDIFTGIAFLTQEEARRLHKQLLTFMEAHTRKRPGTHPWEYSVLAYKMDEEAKE